MTGERIEGTQLLTVGDVGALCKLNPRTVQRAIRAGRLKASQLGTKGAYRIRLEDVEGWIDGSSVPPAPVAWSVGVELRPIPPQRGRLAVGGGAGRVQR